MDFSAVTRGIFTSAPYDESRPQLQTRSRTHKGRGRKARRWFGVPESFSSKTGESVLRALGGDVHAKAGTDGDIVTQLDSERHQRALAVNDAQTFYPKKWIKTSPLTRVIVCLPARSATQNNNYNAPFSQAQPRQVEQPLGACTGPGVDLVCNIFNETRNSRKLRCHNSPMASCEINCRTKRRGVVYRRSSWPDFTGPKIFNKKVRGYLRNVIRDKIRTSADVRKKTRGGGGGPRIVYRDYPRIDWEDSQFAEVQGNRARTVVTNPKHVQTSPVKGLPRVTVGVLQTPQGQSG